MLINVAMTLDGKIDTIERRGAAISSERDRERVDHLRASVDAVMVGGRTLHAEDPRLNVRSAELRAGRVARGEPEQPAKVAITSRFALPQASRFLTAGPARVIIFGDVGPVVGAEVYGTSDLRDVMDKLRELGMRRILVEGGGTLNFALLQAGLVDEVQLYLSPLIFGGSSAPTLADGAGLTRDLAVQLQPPEIDAWPNGGIVLRYMVKRS